MNLNSVSGSMPSRKGKKRVGRGTGSGHGKTASRGHKGQYASAGAKLPTSLFEGGQMPLYRRSPKRGFSNGMHKKTFNVVNVSDLEYHFNENDTVSPETLRAKGLAKKPADGVRILGTGELTKKLLVTAHHFSASAQEKIKAKGGEALLIAAPKPPVRNKMKPKVAKVAKAAN